MRLYDPHRDRGFSHFRATYKPHVRPPHHLRRLRQAFTIDAHFEAEFVLLKPWLQRTQRGWVDQIVEHLLQFDGIGQNFSEADTEKLRKLYQRHAEAFSSGRIDEDYLDSLEDVALFFLFHEVRSVWLAGAYGRLTEAAVDYFFEVAECRRQTPARRLMRCFSKGMTIELSQIQRVFICYERRLQSVVLGGLAELRPGMESMLRDSLFTIAEHGATLAEKFFDGLEERTPELGALAPADADARVKAFVDGLTLAVASLDDADEAKPAIRAFGRGLVDAPLRAEHRSTVEAALLAALKPAFGARWHGDLEQAWTALYRQVSAVALDARDEARSGGDVSDIAATSDQAADASATA